MRVYIRLNSWSGDDKQDAVARLAKMFKMPVDGASKAVEDASGGNAWQFDKAVTDPQAQSAKTYLERLGFDVELVSAQAAPVDDVPEPEPAPQPKEKKSFFSFLFKGKKADKKKEVQGKSLFAFGGAKTEETPAFQESAPAATKAPAQKASKTQDKAKSSPVAAVLLLIILAACAGLPYWFGMQARTLFDESLAAMSQHGMNAQTTSYEQGWLSSTAEFTLSESSLSKSPTVNVKSVITHGPFAYGDWLQGNISLEPFQAKIDSTLDVSTQGLGDFGKIPEIKVVTWAPLAGDWKADVDMPPTKKKLKKGVEVDWQGLKGSFQFPADFLALKGSVNLGPLTVKSKEGTFLLSNVLFALDTFTSPEGLNLGNGSASIDKMSFSDSQSKGSIVNVGMSGMSKAEGPNIAWDFSFQTGKIDLGGENVYGPTAFDMTARNLDAAALAQLQKLAENQTSGKPGGKNPAKIQEQALKLFARITQKKPEFQVSRLSFQTPQGELQGHMKVLLDGTKADISQNPFAVLSILDVDAWALMPKLFVGSVVAESGLPGTSRKGKKSRPMSPSEIAKAINKLEAQNIMVPDGENYKITFAFKDGKALLNGKPLDSRKMRLF